jgi:hypothetical protein
MPDINPPLTAADCARRHRVSEMAYTVWLSLPSLSWSDADTIAEAVVRHGEIRAKVEAGRLAAYMEG